jgi:P4 family phage/plasmid primase-like protien
LSTELLAHAFRLANLGYSVVPVAADGTKRPGIPWKDYALRRPTPDELVAWFAGDRFDGLGIVCGAVSGNFEMVELEGRAVAEDMVEAVADALEDHGLGDLWATLQGYVEHTPSGGLHWNFRVSGGPAAPNTKIARRPAPDSKVDVLIETRGEGGFTVVYPSAGRSHPSGTGWTIYTGSPEQTPTITVEERDAMYQVLAAIFDKMPKELAADPAERKAYVDLFGGVRPGDDYNAKATWESILEPIGWTRLFAFSDGGHAWCRPGKKFGISASTGRNDGDNLYVFSTSTGFDTEKAYSKFAAYTTLHHNGDYAAAAKALREAGFGSQPKVDIGPTFQVIEGGLSQSPQSDTSGTAALDQDDVAKPLTWSDDGMAMLLVNTYGHRIRRCSDRGRWYEWDGHVWAECPKDAAPIRESAKDIARRLPEHTDKALKWKTYAESARGVSAMLQQASSDPRIAIPYSQFDAHPYELNTPGGIVDLTTGQLLPSDPTRLHSRSTLATPNPDADRTVWAQFLDVTFNRDAALIEYLQRLVGYSAIGQVGVHILPYCYGSGGNGKGVFLETIQGVLGDYATSTQQGFLMAKKYPGHETEIARLAGRRFVLSSEVNESDKFDEARVKHLTGGDTLTARFLNENHFTFPPTHTLWAMGNHLPAVQTGGDGFWRRFRTIPFVHKVPPEQRIDDLQGILTREHGDAVLAWIIEGAAKYVQGGLGDEPRIVQVATDEYAHDQDTVSRFLEEACRIGGGNAVQVKMGEVRTAYEMWCRETGDEPVSAKAFGSALRRAGIGSKRSGSNRFYTGVTLLRDEASDDAQEAWWNK